MSHLDEGTLHALLDGELEMTEVKEIQAHLGSCSACGTRLRQVKELSAQADRRVGSLELPGTGAAAAGSRSRSATLEAKAEVARVPAPLPPTPEGPPPIFLPDNPDWSERTRRFVAPMKWAALLVVCVGPGFLASEMRRGPVPSSLPADATDSSSPVLSAEEATPRPDSGALAAAAFARRPAESKMAPARDDLAKSKDTSEGLLDSATAANDETVELAERTEPQPARQANKPAQPAPSNVRNEAAKALQDLDRERRAERAAAATAALDASRRREADAAKQSQSNGAVVVTATNP